MGERFVESALSHGNDLDELLLGIEQDHADQLAKCPRSLDWAIILSPVLARAKRLAQGADFSRP